MRVLVAGASGFIGRHLAHALQNAGHEVVALVRREDASVKLLAARVERCDLESATVTSLIPRLEGVECVVNLAGVFADGAGQSTRVNESGAEALFEACEKARVRRVIHFSALGADDQRTPFARTKFAGERALMARDVDWIILRPSIVLGPSSSGTGGLIRGLAAQPLLPMEEAGHIDAVRLDDVVETVLRLVDAQTPGHRVLDLVGPERLTFAEIVARYREWLGWPRARLVRAPRWAMGLAYFFGDIAGALGWRSPIRSSARTELSRGAIGDGALWNATTGVKARSLNEMLADAPATLEDRRFAQFYFLKPVIFAITGSFWIGTGIISLTIGYDIGVALLREGGMGALSGPSVIAGGWADILIGLGVIFRPTARLALWGAILISLFYAVAGTIVLPRLWEDPIGPMLKIWPIVVLNFVALFMVRDR